MPELKARSSKSTALLPLGIVFLTLAVVMLVLGNLAWIAFFTTGITFLIVGSQARGKSDQPSNDAGAD